MRKARLNKDKKSGAAAFFIYIYCAKRAYTPKKEFLLFEPPLGGGMETYMHKHSINRLPSFVRYMAVTGMSLLFAVVCSLIMSAVAMGSEDPTKNLKLYGEIIFVISMLFCGFSGAKIAVDAKILCGILSAALMLLITVSASLALGGSLLLKEAALAAIGAVAALSGAALGSREKKRKRKR